MNKSFLIPQVVVQICMTYWIKDLKPKKECPQDINLLDTSQVKEN